MNPRALWPALTALAVALVLYACQTARTGKTVNNPSAGPVPAEFTKHRGHSTIEGVVIDKTPVPPPMPPRERVMSAVLPETNGVPMNHLTFSNVWSLKRGAPNIPLISEQLLTLQASTNRGVWFNVTNWPSNSAAVIVARSNFPSGTLFRSVMLGP